MISRHMVRVPTASRRRLMVEVVAAMEEGLKVRPRHSHRCIFTKYQTWTASCPTSFFFYTRADAKYLYLNKACLLASMEVNNILL